MRVLLELFRSADGRLEGVVHAPGTRDAAFTGVLDLLRVLEEIDLGRPVDGGTEDAAAGEDDDG